MKPIQYATLSERGIRSSNDDSICTEKLGAYQVFAVADSSSDHPGGKIASDIAIRCLEDAVRKDGGSPASILKNAIFRADDEIRAESQRSRDREGMSTMLCACLVDENLQCTVLDTGDGGVYLISADGIRTPRERAVSLKPGAGAGSRGGLGGGCREILSHTLGAPRILKENDIMTVSPLDSFLLLNSDGLHGFVRKEEIRRLVLENRENLKAACQALIHGALAGGSDHTITVILARGG